MSYRSTALLIAGLAGLAGPVAAQSGPSWQEVGRLLQTTPIDAGGYVRFNFPRADLRVVVGDVPVPASFALTSWAGFAGTPDSATAMGDLVVVANELGPVLAELARQRIEVAAVHNHLGGESPRITYVHFHAKGTARAIASALDAVLRLTATPRPVSASSPIPPTIDTGMVFTTLGQRGKGNGAMAQVSFQLVPGTVMLEGAPILPALGYGSPVNVLQLTSTRAVATGDFAVRESQLAPMLAALAETGVTVTAVHDHFVGELPRLYFVHFWGDAALPSLLHGLRAAVDSARAHSAP